MAPTRMDRGMRTAGTDLGCSEFKAVELVKRLVTLTSSHEQAVRSYHIIKSESRSVDVLGPGVPVSSVLKCIDFQT